MNAEFVMGQVILTVGLIIAFLPAPEQIKEIIIKVAMGCSLIGLGVSLFAIGIVNAIREAR